VVQSADDCELPVIATSTAVFAVTNLEDTIRFYCTVLGFRQQWLWGDPPDFGCVGLGRVEVFLCLQPELAGKTDGLMHCFFVDDVQALHEAHVAAGAPIVSPLENKPWNLREYTVRDPNGYRLRFAGPSTYEPPATALDALPGYVRIDAGLPDYETYASLFASVGWAVDEAPMRAALTQTYAGVLAADTRDGQTIGMARATGDGRYFMLWDLIVRPSHQGRKIGAAMVQRLLEELRARGAPQGAFVGLFTGRPGFYESLEFKSGGGMHRAL
jgi:catechol 2,3-dioxygenase-like lactoylglutathione lyase family enzyme/GNAT superfamily N-acetyltransferase